MQAVRRSPPSVRRKQWAMTSFLLQIVREMGGKRKRKEKEGKKKKRRKGKKVIGGPRAIWVAVAVCIPLCAHRNCSVPQHICTEVSTGTRVLRGPETGYP
ncbi:hypothetical protein SODALDRAFT_727 [Sodiomyces alkalinus F11]|uniref:Uncharacterized protein n=1 Tax=Sodiomyces alkalinus (strain CBS 110278 / VKM F-3762 / F11) TaxID=1314773 RepID=A0A3N2Q591_SODAK|nr:hypothetical protein SODALDRAFT_727 [Sodiomyces alkalinus F11]ROT41818.1 hypothetical protein SODALDRAFT_727 [Sodiomyces alkalinus F11]